MTSDSLPLAIDMLNNLVMAGAVLWEVDFNILADMPSGPFDLETSSDPNINNTSSFVQSRYDGHTDNLGSSTELCTFVHGDL